MSAVSVSAALGATSGLAFSVQKMIRVHTLLSVKFTVHGQLFCMKQSCRPTFVYVPAESAV